MRIKKFMSVATVSIAIMFSMVAHADNKYSELKEPKNKLLLSSIALSVSDFEEHSKSAYEDVYVFEQSFSDSFGMLNYSSGVGDISRTKGLIIVLTTKTRAFVYYNGQKAYSLDIDEDFKEDLHKEDLGTQLYAISNYKNVEI